MISKEQFLAMHELRWQGVTIGRIAEQYRLDRSTVSRCLNMTEEEFDMHKHGKHNELEQYRGDILDLIKTCPQIRETNVMFRLHEAFHEFECKRSVFYAYMKKTARANRTLQETLHVEQQAAWQISSFLQQVKKHIEITELNATILREIISKIKVYNAHKDAFGKRVQRITIEYNFIGEIYIPD